MPNIAAIDIGSNAVRLAIAKAEKGRISGDIENYREAVRLGGDVFESGLISESAVDRLIAAMGGFSWAMSAHKVEKCRAVATSAMREAKNGDKILERVQAACGITLNVISGEEEARLVFQGVQEKVRLGEMLCVLIDIGGGSVEVSLVEQGKLIHNKSYPIGAVRILRSLAQGKCDAVSVRKVLAKQIPNIEQHIKPLLGKRNIQCSVGTGGNFESIGDLRKKVLGKNRGSLVRVGEIAEIRALLDSLSPDERMEKLGLKRDRADVILPGCVISEELMKLLELEEIQIPRVGLKDGVLVELAKEY